MKRKKKSQATGGRSTNGCSIQILPGERAYGKQLVKDFVARTGEEKTPTANMALSFFSENKIIGWLTGTHRQNERRECVLKIDSMYVDPRYKDPTLFKRLNVILAEYCLKHHLCEMGFYTRRHPQAFLRLLGTQWKLDSHVLIRRFDEAFE